MISNTVVVLSTSVFYIVSRFGPQIKFQKLHVNKYAQQDYKSKNAVKLWCHCRSQNHDANPEVIVCVDYEDTVISPVIYR